MTTDVCGHPALGKVKELSNIHQECLVQSDHLPVLDRVQLGADEPKTGIRQCSLHLSTIVMLPEGNHG